jgi:hypothetical protein
MLVQSFRSPMPGRRSDARAAAQATHLPGSHRQIIAPPLSRPMPGGQDRWVTPSGGVVASLARRVW